MTDVYGGDGLAALRSELQTEVADLYMRVGRVEKRLNEIEPQVVDLRTEVAGLMEQVARGNRINLETQGEMRKHFSAVQQQNLNILELLRKDRQ